MGVARRSLLKESLALACAGVPGLVDAAPELAPSPAAGTGRIALVIGNNRYADQPLNNATNDARAVAALLVRAGFVVELKLDATREQMNAAIDAFGRAADAPGVTTAFFYYAGHAAQLEWRNYLLPVDGRIASAADMRAQCVDLGRVLAGLARTQGRVALIVLDACRDNPFGARWRPSQKGMSPYDAPPGTLLAFATAPGRVAVEFVGRANGLYTEHLVRELSVRGVSIEDALKRVRLNVRIASDGAQVPWESTSLEGDVYLFPGARPTAAEIERRLKDELASWNRVKNSPDPLAWIDYLRRFPDGRFAEVAQARLQRLLARREAAPAPAAPPLRLGAGLAVPARLLGSGNPNSAGSYPFRPVWTPGDEYTFEDRRLHDGVPQRRHRVVVKRVDSAGNRVEMADGSVIDLSGSTVQEGRQRRYDTPIQVNPAELQVGRRWRSRFQQIGASSGSGEYTFRVTGREIVKVPAGEFSAFRIEGVGSFMGPFTPNRGIQLVRWVVPGINLAVRQEVLHQGLVRVLVAARQAVS